MRSTPSLTSLPNVVFALSKIYFVHRNHKLIKQVQETQNQYAYLSVIYNIAFETVPLFQCSFQLAATNILAEICSYNNNNNNNNNNEEDLYGASTTMSTIQRKQM